MARTSRKKNIEEPIQAVTPSQVFPTAIYARLSVENSGKDDDGAALENQIAVCEEYVKSCPHLKLIETYSDNGRTGTVLGVPVLPCTRSPMYTCAVRIRRTARYDHVAVSWALNTLS